jgi:uncharacterized protein (DUF1778 family)
MVAATGRDDRSITINIRAAPKQRDLIDRAAEAMGKTRTEFMLETACRAAENTLLDQTFFLLDEERHAAFQAALDTPPGENPKLRALLTRKAPWDR